MKSFYMPIKSTKIKACADNEVPCNELSLEEKVNVSCDSKSKPLITNVTNENFSFPFTLQSPFLSSSPSENLSTVTAM